jgi:hypothetical protein
MSTLERSKLRALACKVEVTPGTDVIAGSPVAADYLDAMFSISPEYDAIENPSHTASMDSRPAIVGGGRFMLQGVRVPLRGSGTAGTAPDWFRLLRAAGMVGTDTAVAVGAPTAATAGSGVTATLQAPFAATADLYTGMPITLSGNPATARTVLVTSYTAGRVARFSRLFSPVLDTSTLAQIPINNLLRLSDTASDWPRLTFYAYAGGQLFIGTGCIVTSPSIRLTSNGVAMLEFNVEGAMADASPAETTLPATAASVSRPQPPVWRNGECQLGLSTTARTGQRGTEWVFRLGSAGILPPDPEAANGYGVAELMSRGVASEITLMANSTEAPGRVTAMRTAAGDVMVSAMLGSTAGNRLGILMHGGTIQRIRNGSVGGADTETITVVPTVPGTGFTVTAF